MKIQIIRSFFIAIGFTSLVLSFSACLGAKAGGKKAKANTYETFFVGEEGMQYFIKPLSFNNDDGDELALDITFRYKTEIKDSAILNFSIITTDILRNLDSISISNNLTTILVVNVDFLFAERIKKQSKSRFSIKYPLIEVVNLFKAREWNIIVYKQDKIFSFSTPKKTQKKIDVLNYEVFTIL